jgi:hypothetical protein
MPTAVIAPRGIPGLVSQFAVGEVPELAPLVGVHAELVRDRLDLADVALPAHAGGIESGNLSEFRQIF